MTDTTNYMASHACANCGADASVIRTVACCDNPVILNGATAMADDLQNLLAGMVKPLEWVALDNGTFWSKETPVGLIYHVAGQGWSCRNGPMNAAENPKAAAQADYTARTASALDLDALQALIAAAYEDVRAKLLDLTEIDDNGTEKMLSHDALITMIGAIPKWITPTDATAALERVKREARREGIADLLMVERMDDVAAVCREYKIKEPSFRAAIRALADQEAQL